MYGIYKCDMPKVLETPESLYRFGRCKCGYVGNDEIYNQFKTKIYNQVKETK